MEKKSKAIKLEKKWPEKRQVLESTLVHPAPPGLGRFLS
jgi:hypothetical protein